MSLPSRERGLKFRPQSSVYLDFQSLPSRERGLKFLDKNLLAQLKQVAPFTGAWIEITLPIP